MFVHLIAKIMVIFFSPKMQDINFPEGLYLKFSLTAVAHREVTAMAAEA